MTDTAVHKEIKFRFFFQGMTDEVELEELKQKISDTIIQYFDDKKSIFVSVVELKDYVK